VRNFATTFDPIVEFGALWFQCGATYRKSKISIFSVDCRTSFWLSHFANPSPKFYRGQNCEIWLKFGPL